MAAQTQPALEPGILVDRQIRDAMAHGFIQIDPFDEEWLEPATYDLGVGDIAVISTAPKPIDMREQPLLVIEPYASALLQTAEVLALSSRIAGRLGPRSNLLRHGIFVSAGPQIDPGFRGRLFINLLNVTDHPFLIRHQARFLTVEFHALAREPEKLYEGPHQGKMNLSDEDINLILGRGGVSLKEVLRGLQEVQGPLKDTAILGSEVPKLVDLQQAVLSQTSDLLRGLKELALARTTALTVPLTTFAPEPFEVLREIFAVVQTIDAGYTATFFDANICASGDTQEEAVENLKSLLIEIFDDLSGEPPERLGPEPARQLEILKSYIRKAAR